MFYIYAIHNSHAAKTYIGQTQNIDARIDAHNNKLKRNSYTARFQGEWKLIYSESVATRSEALKREKQLKSAKGREYIKQFVPG